MKLGGEASSELVSLLHRTMLRVTSDLEGLRFNTAIAALIELNNEMVSLSLVPENIARGFILMLNPFAPHLAEQLWEQADMGKEGISYVPWPEADAVRAKAETVEMPVQVNGKMRARFEVEVDAPEESVRELALEQPNVQVHLEGKTPKKIIVVPNRMVNIIV